MWPWMFEILCNDMLVLWASSLCAAENLTFVGLAVQFDLFGRLRSVKHYFLVDQVCSKDLWIGDFHSAVNLPSIAGTHLMQLQGHSYSNLMKGYGRVTSLSISWTQPEMSS